MDVGLRVAVGCDDARDERDIARLEVELLETRRAELERTRVEKVLVVGLAEAFQLLACVRFSFTAERLENVH